MGKRLVDNKKRQRCGGLKVNNERREMNERLVGESRQHLTETVAEVFRELLAKIITKLNLSVQA